MSASSGSRESPARVGADIIDLDRYMRAAVRPSRHRPVHTREHFVVDAGGIDRVPVDLSSSTDSGPIPSRPQTREYCKQYSHDSGLSDGSYSRYRHRPHRRISESKQLESSRTVVSNSSVREFKAACEKALREQQEQISRVAELCEKLVQPQLAQNQAQLNTQIYQNVGANIGPNNTTQNDNQNLSPKFNSIDTNTKQNFGQNVCQVNRAKRPVSLGTSDVTSSSGSSRDIRMKDKHRSDSCKTYKLIMGKLDELNKMFVTRRVQGPAARAIQGSSVSVLVCDKVVATEDDGNMLNTPVIMHARRAGGRVQTAHDMNQYAQDRVAQWNNESDIGALGDAYDLDNPLNFYAQAKRLQAHANSHRTSVPTQREQVFEEKSDERLYEQFDSSLCSLCRGYWRVIRRYIKHQLFGTCT